MNSVNLQMWITHLYSLHTKSKNLVNGKKLWSHLHRLFYFSRLDFGQFLNSPAMKVFKDVFTDDELCSDSFPMKIVDDLIYEFKGKHVVRKEGEITLSGSNPSAEEGEIVLERIPWSKVYFP